MPLSAREVKAHYSHRPSETVIQEILDFIRETQAPHLWRGHTHTKPPRNARVVYLGEFELTEVTAAPCPCCSPNHAKYFTSGRIGWFMEEKVIRLMGWQCFRTLSPEAHDAAEERYQAEKQRKADENFILTNLDKVHAGIRAIESNLKVATALELFTKKLHSIVHDTYDMKLSRHMHDGELRVAERGGFRRYATIHGYLILREPRKPLAAQLTHARTALERLDERVLIGHVELLTDAECSRACNIISKEFADARAVVDTIEDLRRFAAVSTASTLRNWGKQRGCPCQIYARRDGGVFKIGKTEDRCQSIVVPMFFESALAQIPALGNRQQRPRRRRLSAKSQAA
jgi:hypothetical protein